MTQFTTSRPYDFIRDAIHGQTIRVAVCGTENSGKTIFLASLASHFEFHDPDRDKNEKDDVRFDLGGGRFIRRFKLLAGEHGGTDDPIAEFPYREAQLAFWNSADPNWPEPTRRPSELAFSFDLRWPDATAPMLFRWLRNARKNHRVTMRFLDVPGERMADFSMVGKDFGEWSDEYLSSQVQMVDSFKRWLDENERKARDGGKSDFDKEEFFKQFGDSLAEAFTERHCRFLSPSTVRISTGGTLYPPDNKTPLGAEIDKRIGVDENHRFAPLSRYWREKRPDIAKEFCKNFDIYKRQIVTPLANWMKSAHCGLFLVDMFAALNRGEAAYEAAKAESEAVLRALRDPESGIGTWIKNGIVRERVDKDKIRIVVTKIDRAKDNDSRKNLVSHAIRMLGTIVRDIFEQSPDKKGQAVVFTECSAAKTKDDEKKVLVSVPPTDSEPDFSRLAGTMNEREMNPAFFETPKHRGPRHLQLDRIARFLLGLPEEGR